MAGFEELGEHARGERTLRVTTLESEPDSGTPLSKNAGQDPYVVLFEKGPHGWAATVPDLPGCVAAARSLEEAEAKIVREMQRYMQAVRKDGRAAPPPITQAKSFHFST